MRNRTIDVLRRAPREETVTDMEEPIVLDLEPSAAIDAGRLLARLSGNLRETLVLTKIKGYSTKECAARQGVSESVVKVRVHRALRKLRALCELEAR